MAERSYHIIIIGGGAAGMAAAVAALREMEKCRQKRRIDGGKVLLLESNDRVGKKILATGNGKCNFTHENISAEYYYTDDMNILHSVLSAFPTSAALHFFEELGMLSRERNGCFYPSTETASTVLDVLRLRLSELGCETLCSIRVEKVEKSGRDFIVSFTEQGKEYRARGGSVILATGSKAGGFLQDKKEDPLRIPKALALQSSPLYPALTKCICREGHYFKQLAGVRTQVILKLFCGREELYGEEARKGAGILPGAENRAAEHAGRTDRNRLFLRQESGELQLTKEGISGIAVFQLSGEIAQKLSERKRMFVEINFLPDFEEEKLEDWAKRRLSLLSGRTLEEFFLGVLHKKILGVCLQAEGLRGAMLPVADGVEMVCSVMRRAMHFTTEVTSVSDMRQAQVCRGGLYLSQFDEKLECKKIPGLFACGEMLNVDGECGGYNLHFAWASGVLAGRAAVNRAVAAIIQG